MSKEPKLVELELTAIHETKVGEANAGAFLFVNLEGESVWVPKFASQDNHDGTFMIEEKWARDKGLI